MTVNFNYHLVTDKRGKVAHAAQHNVPVCSAKSGGSWHPTVLYPSMSVCPRCASHFARQRETA